MQSELSNHATNYIAAWSLILGILSVPVAVCIEGGLGPIADGAMRFCIVAIVFSGMVAVLVSPFFLGSNILRKIGVLVFALVCYLIVVAVTLIVGIRVGVIGFGC